MWLLLAVRSATASSRFSHNHFSSFKGQVFFTWFFSLVLLQNGIVCILVLVFLLFGITMNWNVLSLIWVLGCVHLFCVLLQAISKLLTILMAGLCFCFCYCLHNKSLEWNGQSSYDFLALFLLGVIGLVFNGIVAFAHVGSILGIFGIRCSWAIGLWHLELGIWAMRKDNLVSIYLLVWIYLSVSIWS